MDTLETIFRPLINMINRRISMTTPARELCDELNNKVIALRVKNTGLAAYCQVRRNALSLMSEYENEPDVIITGSPLALVRLSGTEGEKAIRDGSVELSGDTDVAQSFQKLLRFGKPDVEEELSHVIGDVAAHKLGEAARGLAAWGKQASNTLRQNVSEYLQEESRDVPTRYEVDSFSSKVDTLRDDVDRCEARLARLEAASDNTKEA